jgi:anti-sigma28 factor (negative regulator of flagellin synthesis)
LYDIDITETKNKKCNLTIFNNAVELLTRKKSIRGNSANSFASGRVRDKGDDFMQNNPVSSAFVNHAISGYNKTAARRPEKAEAVKRTDVVEIKESDSFEAKLAAASKDISSGIRAADDTQKAEAIAQKIENGSYGIPASDVAKAILGII